MSRRTTATAGPTTPGGRRTHHDGLLTPTEVARIARVSPRQVLAWARAHGIQPLTLSRGTLRYRSAAVLAETESMRRWERMVGLHRMLHRARIEVL